MEKLFEIKITPEKSKNNLSINRAIISTTRTMTRRKKEYVLGSLAASH